MYFIYYSIEYPVSPAESIIEEQIELPVYVKPEPILDVKKILVETPIVKQIQYVEPKIIISKQHLRILNKIKNLNLSDLPINSYDIGKVGPLKPGFEFINFLLNCGASNVKTLQIPIPHTIVTSDKSVQLLTTDKNGYLTCDTNILLNSQEQRDKFVLSCIDNVIVDSKPFNPNKRDEEELGKETNMYYHFSNLFNIFF